MAETSAHVDAVVALDGDRPRRLRAAVTIALQARAGTVVVVRGDIVAPELARAAALPFEFVSFVPDPSTTRGEARGVAQLVQARGWTRTVVVTSSYHLFRARLIFRRVLPAGVEFRSAGSDRSKLPRNALLEGLKLVLALTLRRSA